MCLCLCPSRQNLIEVQLAGLVGTANQIYAIGSIEVGNNITAKEVASSSRADAPAGGVAQEKDGEGARDGWPFTDQANCQEASNFRKRQTPGRYNLMWRSTRCGRHWLGHHLLPRVKHIPVGLQTHGPDQ
eukprot:g42389.t1